MGLKVPRRWQTLDHCLYGHRADGTCRACPQRTFWANDGCRPVAEDLTCPEPNQARVSSWPGECVWLLCPPDPGTPNLLEYRDLTDGDCTDLDNSTVCPDADENWFPEYATWSPNFSTYQYSGCKPIYCRYGRTSTGNCQSPPTTTTTTTTMMWTVEFPPWAGHLVYAAV